MKKIWIVLMCGCIKLQALYFGNPASPQIIEKGFFIPLDSLFSCKLGFEKDWVFDRKVHLYGNIKGYTGRFESGIDQGLFTLVFLDRLEVYGSVGSFQASFSNRLSIDNKQRDYNTSDKITYGGGARLVLAQFGKVIIGVDGKFQYSNPRIDSVTVNGVGYSSHAKVLYRESQAGFGISFEVKPLMPYIGVKYSEAVARVNGLGKDISPLSRFKMRSKGRCGMVVGCTVSTGKIVDLTFEAALFDEQSATVAGNLKF
jgi:hypothetical protein